MDKKVAMEEIAKTQQTRTRLDTQALPINELIPGMHYSCILAGDRRVQYIGGNQIKWHSEETDEYRISEVHDYQLKPIDHKGGATGLEGL